MTTTCTEPYCGTVLTPETVTCPQCGLAAPGQAQPLSLAEQADSLYRHDPGRIAARKRAYRPVGNYRG